MAQNQNNRDFDPIPILIVEDDEVDLMSIQRALKTLRIANPTLHAKDGEEALHLLYGTQGYKKITDPEIIILLDLNMPRIGGLEFLEKLRSDEDLPICKVFVLTTSEADSDIVSAYKQSISGYVLKSHLLETLSRQLQGLKGDYWKMIVRPN